MKPITIGDEGFSSIKQANVKCRELLNRYDALGGDIPDGPDRDFVMALLNRHPKAEEKIGSGVRSFRVGWTEATQGKCSTRHFFVKRADGTEEHFSYDKCVHGGSHREDCLDSMRDAVVPQAHAVRAGGDEGGVGMHAHHGGDGFGELANRWLRLSGIAFDQIMIAPHEIGVGKKMTDPDQKASWQAYHAENATLVAMEAGAHLHLPKGSRREVA
jgi:hypothetical protein